MEVRSRVSAPHRNREVQTAALRTALEDTGFHAMTAGDADPIARDSPPHTCIDHICIGGGVPLK
jgi:hypothetical protein